MTSTQLFPRDWTVQVDTLDVSTLDLEFKILATLKAEPNKCVLTVWNLNQDHRAQLLKRNRPNPASSKLVGIPVQIEAGYVGNTSVLFSGDLREVGGQLDHTDRKTVLAGDDGGRSYREARISQTFTKGTQIGLIIQQCAQALGIGLGNTANFTQGAQIAGIGSQLPHTMTLAGNAAAGLTRVLDSVGLTWSIQRGAIQVLQKGTPLNLGAILLSADSGLVGSPEASIDASISLGNPQASVNGKVSKAPKPKDTSIIKGKAMLIPGLVPGRKIVIQSSEINGGYMLTEIEYVGQTWANDWYCNFVARVY